MIQSITFFKNPEDILLSHGKSNTIDSKNTYDDWHIIADSRPIFTPPKAKTTDIDVPGGNGSLDLSESLTRFPLYENRTGSFKFKVLNEWMEDGKPIYATNDKRKWAERYSDIMNFLHGKCFCAVLDDDPNWFYQGRFTVDAWDSGNTWSEITIGYNVNPFKWSISSSVSDWLWDPFNFETGVLWSTICKNILVNSDDTYKEILLPTYIKDAFSIEQFFGKVPISPTITFEPINELGGLDVRFTNDYLGIDIEQRFQSGTTYAPDFLIYGQPERYKFCLRGKGKVSIDFRVGRL